MELGQGRVGQGVRKRFCTQRVNRLLRVLDMALSLEFKKCLDKTLRHKV